MRNRNLALMTGAGLVVLALTPLAPASATTVSLTGGAFTISYDEYSSSNGGPGISGILSGTLNNAR